MRGRRSWARAVVVALLAALVVPVMAGGPTPAAADPPPAAGVVALAGGYQHTCALRANATVKCWGQNDNGQLGLGDLAARGDALSETGAGLPVVNLGTGRTATAIAAGYGSHTCAILDNAKVKCWGDNAYGQLGLGDTQDRGDGPGEMGDDLAYVDLGTGRTATAIAVGDNHTCALLDNGVLKCWGFAYGLGAGSFEDRGDEPGEMGDALPAVDLGTGRTAAAVSAGQYLTCALLDNATVKCWGLNYRGGLGLGDTTKRGTSPGQMGDALPVVDLGTGRTASQVSVSGSYTCAVLDDASVKCWGRNDMAQLGLGDTQDRGDQPGEMGDALPAVSLGSGRTATSVVTGFRHTCAVLGNGGLKCWGENTSGELGLGTTATPRGDLPGEMGDALPPIDLGASRTATAVTVSGSHTCALLDSDMVKCWGVGSELGLGGFQTRGDGPGEMGDNLPVVVLDASPTVSVAADEASVAAGATIHVHVTVTNPGDGALANVVVDGGNATGCDAVIPVLAAGAQQVIDCVHATTGMDLPSFTATASATSTQTPAAVSSSQLTVPVALSPTIGAVAGTVRETGTLAPIAGGLVALLAPADFSLVGYANARADGTYSTVAAPGNYFVYALDPAGAHLAGFVGAPTQVTVTGGATTAANPTLAPAAGGFSGTVTETGTGDPINNVLVVSLDTATGRPGAGGLTSGSGAYTVSPLPSGSRYGIFVDLAGAHVPEFHNDSPGIAGAAPISVGGGTTTGVNAALAPATPPGGGAIVQGSITDSVTNVGLSGVAVIALRSADLSLAAGTITGSGGTYSLDIDPGAYKLEFYSLAGSHLMEWYDDLPFTGIGSAFTVNAIGGSPSTVDADLEPSAGTAAGTVTEDGTGDPLTDVWVIAIGPGGTVRATTTAANGSYSLTGLGPGEYRLRFVDPSAAHAAEYHLNAPGPDTATPITVVGGQTTTTPAALEALP